MAVALESLVESLRREVNPPGGDSFPNAFEDSYVGYLADAFWEIRLDGVTSFNSFEELDGFVSSESGEDLDRTSQQLIVLYAGIRMLRNQLLNIQTLFRAKAGPVEYETQQSALLLRGILEDLKSRRNVVLSRLSDLGATETFYIDAVIERDRAIDSGLTAWTG